jgi:hypothetical protein
VDGPEAEVGQDVLDDRGVVNEGDDPHRAATLRPEHQLHLIDLLGDWEDLGLI